MDKKKREKKERKRIEFEKYSLKEKLLISCLTGFAVSFVLFLFGPFDIYANNMQEFAFTFKDIAPMFLLLFLAFAVVISGLLMLLQRFALNIFSSIPISILFAGIIDGIISRRASIISGDVKNLSDAEYYKVMALLIITVLFFVYLSIVLAKKWKSVIAFLCILLIGMNGASLAADFVTKDLIHDNDINCDYVLSQKGLSSVSEKENIIYILFDRFDNEYIDEIKKKDPEFFNDLEGFTYFDCAVSKYTRTFPGVSYMLSGNEYSADMSAQEYLDSTYKNSQFLKDLKNNGYRINIYADRYYEYTDAKALKGIADNVEKVKSYKVNKKACVNYLSLLSFARTINLFLSIINYANTNNGMASTLSTLECENDMYHDDDAWLSDYYKENKITADESDKRFTFIYMHGCHAPYILNENGDFDENADVISQTVGSFKTVKLYLQQLKEAGAYDNSTIIISGDHGAPIEEFEPFHTHTNKGVTTAIMVKPRNAVNKKTQTVSTEVAVEDTIPAIVKDAGIKTDRDYGKSIFDFKDGESRTRIYYQSVYDVNQRKLELNKYEIKGNARDIKNWKLTEKIKSEHKWY